MLDKPWAYRWVVVVASILCAGLIKTKTEKVGQ